MHLGYIHLCTQWIGKRAMSRCIEDNWPSEVAIAITIAILRRWIAVAAEWEDFLSKILTGSGFFCVNPCWNMQPTTLKSSTIQGNNHGTWTRTSRLLLLPTWTVLCIISVSIFIFTMTMAVRRPCLRDVLCFIAGIRLDFFSRVFLLWTVFFFYLIMQQYKYRWGWW